MDAVSDVTLARLEAGGRAHAGRDAAGRAALALATARSVAALAERWVDAALAIKRVPPASWPAGAERAEEISTGPLVTLRLLLVTARALGDVARQGVPQPARPPRLVAVAGRSFVGVPLAPERRLLDGFVFQGHEAVARCVDPGGLEAFAATWREEAATRPRAGGVALVLGAGNVTGLSVGDALAQIFEHGRAVLLKLHPLHAPLEPVLREALAPLVAADLVAITTGGPETVAAALATPQVTHVHLTGGRAAFDALVWGAPGPPAAGAVPRLDRPITCELGSVTPWIVLPGHYPPAALRFQADLVAASIANNTSFNCIATKCVITCRGWEQRAAFLDRVAERLARLAPRPGWYPGAAAAWERVAGLPAPADGTLPPLFHAGLDPRAQPHWLAREWFVPVAVEVPLDASDTETFCTRATDFVRGLPGSLAASVTLPPARDPREAVRAERLIGHLERGVVAVNTWTALAYALGSLPWGGYPGGTLAEPRSGIGRVHDPLLLPLVHDCVLRAPLVVRPAPPWLPWHPRAARLAHGLLGVYATRARGGSGLWRLATMLPDVLRGGS